MNNASIILSFIDGITEYNFSHWKYERCENLNLKKINASNYIFNEKYFNSVFAYLNIMIMKLKQLLVLKMKIFLILF